MDAIFGTLGVAFAACCVWLVVRMANRRKNPGVAFWASVALVLGYPLSFGPACWWLSEPLPLQAIPHLTVRKAPWPYGPIGWIAGHTPRPLNLAINWFATIGIDDTEAVACGISAVENGQVVFWRPASNRL